MPRDVVGPVADEPMARPDLRTCGFAPFPFDGVLPRSEPVRIVIPAAEPGARSFVSWHPGDGVELSVRYNALSLGRFVLVAAVSTCGVALLPTFRANAVALARLVGEELARRWTVTDLRVSAEREASSWPTS